MSMDPARALALLLFAIMPRPTLYKTDEEKAAAKRAKSKRYYDRYDITLKYFFWTAATRYTAIEKQLTRRAEASVRMLGRFNHQERT